MSHLPPDAHRVLNPQPGQPQADAVRQALAELLSALDEASCMDRPIGQSRRLGIAKRSARAALATPSQPAHEAETPASWPFQWRIAEHVLQLDMVTPKGLRAKELADSARRAALATPSQPSNPGDRARDKEAMRAVSLESLGATPSQPAQPAQAVRLITYHKDDDGPGAAEAYAAICACLDDNGVRKLANMVAHGAKATLGTARVALTRADWGRVHFIALATPSQAKG